MTLWIERLCPPALAVWPDRTPANGVKPRPLLLNPDQKTAGKREVNLVQWRNSPPTSLHAMMAVMDRANRNPVSVLVVMPNQTLVVDLSHANKNTPMKNDTARSRS